MSMVSHQPQEVQAPSKYRAVAHFGKPTLTREEAREHNEFLAQAKHFHPCPDCNGGEYRLFRCDTCQGRHFLLPAALVKRLGLEAFLLTGAEERALPHHSAPQRAATLRGEGEVPGG